MIDQSDTTAPPAPTTPVWRRRPALLAVLGVLVLAAAATVWATHSSSSPSTITVHGTISLTNLQYGDNTNPGSPIDGDSCAGFDGYSDIAPGLTITVEGAAGQPLASTLLQAGVMQDAGITGAEDEGLCVLPFTVQVPAGQSQYAVTIPKRGAQLFTPAQIAAGVQLSINVG